MRARAAAGGSLLAAAGVLVTLAILAVESRMGSEWSDGVVFLISVLAAIPVLGVGLLAAKGGGRPDGAATALILAGLLLSLVGLIQLAGLSEANGAGTVAFVALAFCSLALYPAVRCSSPVCALIAAAAFAVAFGAAVEGVFGFDDASTVRAMAVVLALGFAVAGWRTDATDRHRSVQLVNAAGFAVLGLVMLLTAGGFFGGPLLGVWAGGGTAVATSALGWEIVAAVGCAALLSYAVVRREPGPGYIGALSTAYFVGLAASPDDADPSLVGWPLVLAVLAAVAVVAALRTTPAPRDSVHDSAETEPAA